MSSQKFDRGKKCWKKIRGETDKWVRGNIPGIFIFGNIGKRLRECNVGTHGINEFLELEEFQKKIKETDMWVIGL